MHLKTNLEVLLTPPLLPRLKKLLTQTSELDMGSSFNTTTTGVLKKLLSQTSEVYMGSSVSVHQNTVSQSPSYHQSYNFNPFVFPVFPAF